MSVDPTHVFAGAALLWISGFAIGYALGARCGHYAKPQPAPPAPAVTALSRDQRMAINDQARAAARHDHKRHLAKRANPYEANTPASAHFHACYCDEWAYLDRRDSHARIGLPNPAHAAPQPRDHRPVA